MRDTIEKLATGEFELVMSEKHNCGFLHNKTYEMLVDEVDNSEIQHLIDMGLVSVSALPGQIDALTHYELTEEGRAWGWTPYSDNVVWPGL